MREGFGRLPLGRAFEQLLGASVVVLLLGRPVRIGPAPVEGIVPFDVSRVLAVGLSVVGM